MIFGPFVVSKIHLPADKQEQNRPEKCDDVMDGSLV